MSTSKIKDEKYVLMTIVVFFALLTSDVITKFNYLDVAYWLFLVSCVVRYILICRHE